MIVGVIGGGTVGRATAQAFARHVEEVRVFDRIAARATAGLYWTLQAELVFVCLPAEELEPFFESLNPGPQNFVVKSTVPVGTTRRLQERFPDFRFVHSPEFLSERTALLDALMPARLIVGAPHPHRGHGCWPEGQVEYFRVDDFLGVNEAARLFRKLCQDQFPLARVLEMSSDESELVKLVDNAFSAVKVSFFNEARSLADELELDWERVIGGVLAGGRVHPEHTRVPGPDGKRGFGGRCLPKDLAQFNRELMIRGLSALVGHAAILRNREDREL